MTENINNELKNEEAVQPEAQKNVRLKKIASVIGTICSIGVVVSVLLYIFDVIEHAKKIYMPLLGVVMITQAIQLWRTKSHTLAVFSLVIALCIFAVTVLKLIIK